MASKFKTSALFILVHIPSELFSPMPLAASDRSRSVVLNSDCVLNCILQRNISFWKWMSKILPVTKKYWFLKYRLLWERTAKGAFYSFRNELLEHSTFFITHVCMSVNFFDEFTMSTENKMAAAPTSRTVVMRCNFEQRRARLLESRALLQTPWLPNCDAGNWYDK